MARKELINYFRNRKHIKGFIGDKEPLVDYIKLNKYEELKVEIQKQLPLSIEYNIETKNISILYILI